MLNRPISSLAEFTALRDGKDLTEVCAQLFETCTTRFDPQFGYDDMTIVIVLLDSPQMRRLLKESLNIKQAPPLSHVVVELLGTIAVESAKKENIFSHRTIYSPSHEDHVVHDCCSEKKGEEANLVENNGQTGQFQDDMKTQENSQKRQKVCHGSNSEDAVVQDDASNESETQIMDESNRESPEECEISQVPQSADQSPGESTSRRSKDSGHREIALRVTRSMSRTDKAVDKTGLKRSATEK